MLASDGLWPQASAAPDPEDVDHEIHSLYSSAAWRTGKKQGPPPIFASIGFRHPQCTDFDIQLREKESIEALLLFTRKEIRRFDAGNVVIALASLPKLAGARGLESFCQHLGWVELEERVSSCIQRLEPRGLAMVSYAAARLRWRDQSLLEAIIAAAEKRIGDFGSTDIAKLSWSLAKLCILDPAKNLWASLAKEGSRKCCTGSFIDISMIAWAFASIGLHDRALFGQLATAIINREPELPPQTISNIAWAFAKAKMKNELLFEALARRSIETAAQFDTQGVSNTLWGFASLGINHEGVFAALGEHTVNSALWRHFSPQMASNVIWAFSRAGITDVPVFTAITQYIREQSHRFDNQNISNCAWAFALAELQSKEVFNVLTQCALGRLRSFRMSELSGLLWAFARAKVADSPIFEEAVEVLMPRQKELDSQGLSNLIWILATVGHLRGSPVPGGRELIDNLLSSLFELRVRLDSEGAAMTVWALWRAGRFHDAWTLYIRTLSDGRHPALGKTWARKNAMDGRQQYWQTLLMESERRGDVSKQVYLWKQMAADSYSRAMRAAFLNCAVMAFIARGSMGDLEDAIELLKQLVRTKLGNVVTWRLAEKLHLREEIEPAEMIDNVLRRRPQNQSRYEDFHHKEIRALETVINTAEPDDPESIAAVIEDLALVESSLKVSGGEKACVLDNVLQRHRPTMVLEFGSYVGYTTTRIAHQVRAWGGRCVSFEMDPINVAISRNIVELAGLSDVAKVQVGHSDDSLEIVVDECGAKSIQFVFMDQRVTRFHADLQKLEVSGVLADPCCVIADNVLNPGAPLHVWRVCSMPQYATDIVSLRKFGNALVQDWMTISMVRTGDGYGCEADNQPALVSLARGADRFRGKVKNTPAKDMAGEPTSEFASQMINELARLGYGPSLGVLTLPKGERGVTSALVQLQPGEEVPLWDGAEVKGRVQGGCWRPVIADPQPLS